MFFDYHSGMRGADPTMNSRSHQASPKHAAKAVDSRSNHEIHNIFSIDTSLLKDALLINLKLYLQYESGMKIIPFILRKSTLKRL